MPEEPIGGRVSPDDVTVGLSSPPDEAKNARVRMERQPPPSLRTLQSSRSGVCGKIEMTVNGCYK